MSPSSCGFDFFELSSCNNVDHIDLRIRKWWDGCYDCRHAPRGLLEVVSRPLYGTEVLEARKTRWVLNVLDGLPLGSMLPGVVNSQLLL